MRATGRSIRVRKSPSFSGRSLYLDGITDFIDMQALSDETVTGAGLGNTMYSNWQGWRNGYGSPPVETNRDAGAYAGRLRTRRTDGLNYGIISDGPNATLRPAVWSFWVKFPQNEFDKVKVDWDAGKDAADSGIILRECNAAGFNNQRTRDNVGNTIAITSNTSGSYNVTMGNGVNGGGTIAGRLYRRGNSMLAPDEWYNIVCQWKGGGKLTGVGGSVTTVNPEWDMWVNGKTRANVTLKLKDHSSSNKSSLVRIEDADGVVKYYDLNARTGNSHSTGTAVNYQQYLDGIPNGSYTFQNTITVKMNGLSAAESAEQIKAAIESSDGHNGSIICTTDGTGYITLQQKTPGTSGNVDIKLTRDGGGDHLGELDNIFELNGQILQVAGQSNKYYSASFSNGTDKAGINAQNLAPFYPKGTTSGDAAENQNFGGNSITYGTSIQAVTTFVGRTNYHPPRCTNMWVSQIAFWENTQHSTDDVTGLYGDGTPLADLTADSNGYTNSQPKTASLVLPTHGMSEADRFRLEDANGKFVWFRLSDTQASYIGQRVATVVTDAHDTWSDENNVVHGEFRIVFGTGAIYSGPPVIRLISMNKKTGATTEISYQGTDTSTANGTIVSGNPSFITNAVSPAAKAGNLAAAITSSNGHGASVFSCSIFTTAATGDTLIIRDVEGGTINQATTNRDVTIDSDADFGFSYIINSGYTLSGSFQNGGNTNCIHIPLQLGDATRPKQDESIFPDSDRTEANLLEIARIVTGSIQSSRAFGKGNALSCSIVYANEFNQVTPSASGVQPAVRVHSTIAGGVGNRTIIYGDSNATDGGASGWPIPGYEPRQHHLWGSNNVYTGSKTNHRGLRELTGYNSRWHHRGTLSQSFSGGGLRLLGWWKIAGPAVDPREPAINVISQTVATESMLERPIHLRFENWHHAHEEKIRQGTDPDNPPHRTKLTYDGGEDHEYIRTNPALNIGGTWTSDSPQG